MALGPVELLMVKFPGNQFKGEIVPALTELIDGGMIRVIDLLFVNRDADGSVEMVELNDLDDESYVAFDPVVGEIMGLLSDEDTRQLAESLENNSSAAVMLFENTWATRFADAIANAKGEVVMAERIPRAVIGELMQAREATTA